MQGVEKVSHFVSILRTQVVLEDFTYGSSFLLSYSDCDE